LEATRELRLGIRSGEPAAHVLREQIGFLVAAEEADRVEIAALLIARDVPQEILAARSVRHPLRRDRGDAAQRARRVPIERDHPRMRNIAIVAAEQLVAAVAR